MSILEGTITTPFGAVQKKTALIVGGGLAGVLVIVWYRSKKASDAASVAASGEAVGINPATGYVYGSAEDAAAMANQAAYVDPTSVGYGGGGGSSYAGSVTGSYVNNGQWSQAAVQYMQGQGLIEDPSQLATALGKYIAGSPVTDTQKSLIEQAIAFQGYPPVSGVAGYPPSINTAPVAHDDTPPPPDTTPPPPNNTPPPPPPPPPPPARGPQWVNVFKGQIVDDWVRSTGVDWGTLIALNPIDSNGLGLEQNVSKNNDPRKRVFLYNTAYKLYN